MHSIRQDTVATSNVHANPGTRTLYSPVRPHRSTTTPTPLQRRALPALQNINRPAPVASISHQCCGLPLFLPYGSSPCVKNSALDSSSRLQYQDKRERFYCSLESYLRCRYRRWGSAPGRALRQPLASTLDQPGVKIAPVCRPAGDDVAKDSSPTPPK